MPPRARRIAAALTVVISVGGASPAPAASPQHPRIERVTLVRDVRGEHRDRLMVLVRARHGARSRKGRHRGRLDVTLRGRRGTVRAHLWRSLRGGQRTGAAVQYRLALSRPATRRLLGRPAARAGASAENVVVDPPSGPVGGTFLPASVTVAQAVDRAITGTATQAGTVPVRSAASWPPPGAIFGNGWDGTTIEVDWTDEEPYRPYVSVVDNLDVCWNAGDGQYLQADDVEPRLDANDEPQSGFLQSDGSYSVVASYSAVAGTGPTGPMTGRVTPPGADGRFASGATATARLPYVCHFGGWSFSYDIENGPFGLLSDD